MATQQQLKDPKGGLTKAGREHYKKTEGAHLKPGVRGKADTPEKMKRKGSFLRRHFAHPRGPMTNENGEPTRLALSAHAWGEKVPKTKAEAKKLADKGTKLLEKYHKASEGKKSAAGKSTTKKSSKKSPKKAAKKSTTKKKAAKKTSKKSGKKSTKKTTRKKSA